jgi:hypothetical protein
LAPVADAARDGKGLRVVVNSLLQMPQAAIGGSQTTQGSALDVPIAGLAGDGKSLLTALNGPLHLT